ncbi:MAG: SMP-30/gluconolactonase/LRE family protein [Kineosporiaceae bacterium]
MAHLEVLAGPVDQVLAVLGFTEGPCWLAEHDAWLFTDIPRNAIMRWPGEGPAEVWCSHSHFAIGLARAVDGRVLAYEHSTRSLTALEVLADGSCGDREVLARSVGDCVLNSTNDVVAAPGGAVWFTDPPFGVREESGGLVGYEQAMERPCDVLAVGPDPASATVVVSGIHRPNGLCLSPDGSTLYVSDSSTRHHRVHAVALDDSGPPWGPGDVLWTMPVGVPDGMRCDVEGNLWVAGGDGVYVVSPVGEQVGHVPVPEMVTNVCFGGADMRTLLVTATTRVHRVRTAVAGVAATPA